MSRVTEFQEDEGKPLRGSRIVAALLSPLRRTSEFYNGVKSELRKTSWPTRSEVSSTTVVVIIAVLFFGFYLWGVDRLVTLGFRYLDKVLGK